MGYSPKGCKESDTTEWLRQHSTHPLPLPQYIYTYIYVVVQSISRVQLFVTSGTAARLEFAQTHVH